MPFVFERLAGWLGRLTGLGRNAAARRRPRFAWARVDEPEAEFRDDGIHIAKYPFAPSAAYPGDVFVPISRITALFDSIPDAGIVLDAKEVLFLPKALKEPLKAFAAAHEIPAPRIAEIWMLLAEPFLDTEYTPEDEARDFRTLATQGFPEAEVRRLREEIGPTMMARTVATWEWGFYTTQDVLRTVAMLAPARLDAAFYAHIMEVALRPYRSAAGRDAET